MQRRNEWLSTKRYQKVLLGAVAGAVALATVQVEAQTLDQNFDGKDHYRFVIVPKAVAPWFDSVNAGAEQAARMIEAQSGAEVEIVYSAPQESQVAIQNQILEQAIATRPDGIAVDPLDANANRAILQEALDQGIKVVIFDSPAPEGLEVSSVGNDFCEQAQIASRRLVELLGEEGQVAIMMGTPTAPNHAIRVRCHQAVFSEYPDIEVVATGINNDSIVQAQNQAATIMQAHPDLDGWVVSEASGPIGIGQALKEGGKVGEVQLVGLERLPEMLQLVEEGVADSTVANRPEAQGYWTVQALWQQVLDIAAPDYMDTGVDLITRDNLGDFQ
ncbi:substrate-binding domain-containing protein [Salinicola sp. MIT1003]|uniref:substrate-binding domain-containing protein n=1 Tax=Salinicola sp. MIT1003 TaxID=1882734 RepID=UPI0008DD7A19|nr:substrate-binding domain-containing protein [Salinicola sp. MIT1003]MEC8919088.1 substrate-binding domain-containing protein [Pseudomonadota bacterium]OHZ01804.1 sugar ABC transporter substrate-binding protein [Salinicola sp. MIT1003]